MPSQDPPVTPTTREETASNLEDIDDLDYNYLLLY
jgi:hypothetical protein